MIRKTFITLLLISCALLSGAQQLPDSVAKFIKVTYLKPLCEVDTFSKKKLPSNFITLSGWHVVYYANVGYPDALQLNLYRIIYKGNIFSWAFMPREGENIKYDYDTLRLVKETTDYLYFTIVNPEAGDNIVTAPKTSEGGEYQDGFSDMVYKNFDTGIFIESLNEWDTTANIPHLVVTNIKTGNIKGITYKNQCNGGSMNKYITSITYSDGVLTVTANLTKKKHKPITEVHKVKI